MIPRSEINLGKELGIPQLVQEVIYSRQRVLILDYHGIQISVVCTSSWKHPSSLQTGQGNPMVKH
jgi:hypothetical protein